MLGTGKNVMLGMSGGVDSSVAALLLLKQGYNVVGVTMHITPDSEKDICGNCCSLTDVEDARNVAAKLNIPHYVLNFKYIFKQNVIDYFIKEYTSGRTPNPCIMCNKFIKFDHMLKKAKSMGMDYIATGHYAKIGYYNITSRFLLKKSSDLRKDQTYVLYNCTQDQLSMTMFPLGNYTKEQIREIAKKNGLINASKPDSQEICFIPDNDYRSFLEKNIKINPGNFVDMQGKILGTHKGVPFYTIGQRKGLNIAVGKPMHVVSINTKNNTIVLGDEKDIFSSHLIASNLNWIAIEKLEHSIKVNAKIRYSAKEAPATIQPHKDGNVRVIFDQPQKAITPGQSVVFYDQDIVIGGGIIDV